MTASTAKASVPLNNVPWTRVDPRVWEYTSGDGKTLLRVRRVGMRDIETYYVYRDGKILGIRKDVDEAKALAESGVCEVPPGRLVPDQPKDPLDLPESLRMTTQQRAAGRASTPPRPYLDPKMSTAPKAPQRAPEVVVGRSGVAMASSGNTVRMRGIGPPTAETYVDPDHARRVSARLSESPSKVRMTDDAVIVVRDENPRRAGSAGYEHYERMRGKITVGQYVARHKSDKDKRTARQWLSNTLREGYAHLEAGGKK